MNSKVTFLQIIRLGIGHYADRISDNIEWNDIQALAEQQGLYAILLDGIEKLPEKQRPDKELLLQWIGETFRGYEYRYELYRRTIAEMAGWYNSHGFKMMVLKGLACSLDWPKPEHRPCGDIDIWLFGNQKEADIILIKEMGIGIDNSHHHHTTFSWRGFLVENHYDFINIHHHKSNVELDRALKELAADDSYFVDVCGEKVYVPSPIFHAFFLMRHTMNHFSSSEITFRQLLDWAFFVEKHTKEIDWAWLTELLEKFHMIDFFNCINAICVENLGFTPSIFPTVQFLPSMKEKVLNDILCPKYTADEPRELIKRLVYKYRRWKGNEWKHKICYSESMWSAFWSGMWSHLLKPASI